MGRETYKVNILGIEFNFILRLCLFEHLIKGGGGQPV